MQQEACADLNGVCALLQRCARVQPRIQPPPHACSLLISMQSLARNSPFPSREDVGCRTLRAA